jgi:hypothetical protein
VDGGLAVPESNEGNNCAASPSSTSIGVVIVPESPCVASPTAIAYGQVVPCAIGALGDVQQFTFTGALNDRITVMLIGRSASTAPCLSMIDPSGATVIGDMCVNGGAGLVVVSTTLRRAGTYTIGVRDDGHDGLAEYVVSVIRTAP